MSLQWLLYSPPHFPFLKKKMFYNMIPKNNLMNDSLKEF